MGDLLPHCSQSGSLLLLQRNAAVARALARLLGRYFATVSVAHTPEEAERVLERREATHLICGQDFGDGQPLGQDLILAWRGRYPSLEQVILASGAEGLPSNLLGV